MCRNDLRDPEVWKRLFPSLFSDFRLSEHEVKNNSSTSTTRPIAAILVVDNGMVFVWIPSIIPSDEIDNIRSEIERLNKKTGAITKIRQLAHDGLVDSMIVCPRCLCGSKRFIRRCEGKLKKHIKTITVQYMGAKAFKNAFPDLVTT